MSALIPSSECARVFSILGTRPFRNAGAGFSSGRFDPRHLAGCAAMYCTNLAAFPGARVLATDPCVNGTFAADATWTKGADWTINGGVAKHAAVGANDLTQACLAVGNTYAITYTVTQQSAGTITVYAGTTAGTARVAAGTYTETLLCAGNTTLKFAADAACDAWIDNVVLAPQNVATLTDLTGNGRHLVQATAASQPLWVASGAGGVLRFDGAADRVRAAFALNQPCHHFVLAKWTYAVGGTRYLWDGAAVTQGAMICNDGAFPGKGIPHAGSYGPQQAFNTATWYVWDVGLNGASTTVALNGGAQTTGNSGVANPGGFVLGASGNEAVFASADAAAVVIYDHILSEPDRQRVVRWMLRQKAMLAL